MPRPAPRTARAVDCRRRRNRHPRLRAPEVAARLGVVGDEHVEHLEQVGHRAGVRDDDVHRRHERPVAAHRDDAPRRRVGAQRVVRRRRAAARPGLLAESEGREARRGRGARAVRRAGAERGRQEVAVVGALGAAVQPPLHPAVRHRRHVREADQHAAGRAQALDRERVARRDEVGERGRARRDRHPAHHEAVLRGVGDAVERPERTALASAQIGCRGLRPRVGIELDHGVERGSRRGRTPRCVRGTRRRGRRSWCARARARRGARAIVASTTGKRLGHQANRSVVCASCRCTRSTTGRYAVDGCCWVMQWMPPPRARIGPRVDRHDLAVVGVAEDAGGAAVRLGLAVAARDHARRSRRGGWRSSSRRSPSSSRSVCGSGEVDELETPARGIRRLFEHRADLAHHRVVGVRRDRPASAAARRRAARTTPPCRRGRGCRPTRSRG